MAVDGPIAFAMSRVLEALGGACALVLWAPAFAAQGGVVEPQPVRASVLFSQYDVRSASFTADQRSVYFVLKIAEYRQAIFVSHRGANGWSEPEVLPIAGTNSSHNHMAAAAPRNPFITPDGTRLLYVDRQPGHPDLDIWEMDKTASGWSAPHVLGADVNSPADDTSPWLAPSGRLYFASARSGSFDLYSAEPAGNGFGEVRALTNVNTSAAEFEPTVSPDEEVLVFTASGRPEELELPGALYPRPDLYISRKAGNVWQPAQHLPAPINSGATEAAPAFSADGRWLYFMSERYFAMNDEPLEYSALQRALARPRNGNGNIYRVPVSALGMTR